MKRTWKIAICIAAAVVLVGVSLPALSASGGEQYQAQAMGEGTQMGQTFGVTININEYSTTEDQQVLIQALETKGTQGVYNALDKMGSKGRIRITGTLGFDANYIHVIQMPDGMRKIRLVTDRPITFGEAWTDSRSEDYNLSALELDVDANGKGTGTLLPACQFKIKNHQLEIDALRNPWRLVDVFRW
ncbi:MAG TPA: hypothetical protein VE783_12740 [Candidatus Limnocylindrales bacterium]|nr:hypothetical protein [Candidatus Limnocylindrales bacterium]